MQSSQPITISRGGSPSVEASAAMVSGSAGSPPRCAIIHSHAGPMLGCLCTQTQDKWFILCHAMARLDTLFW